MFFGRCRQTRYKVRNAIREMSEYCGNYFDRARQNTLNKYFCVFKNHVTDVKITQKIILTAGVEIVTAFQKPATVLVPTVCKQHAHLYAETSGGCTEKETTTHGRVVEVRGAGYILDVVHPPLIFGLL